MNSAPLISVVVPVYRGEACLSELTSLLVAQLLRIDPEYEIILVNDASPDDSWGVIENECTQNDRVKGINLSRNFGQHYAIYAGLSFASGDWVVVMDCDLQDNPEELVRFYHKAREGFDIVVAQREKRVDSLFRRFVSFVFYSAFSYLTGTEQDATVCNFGMYHSKVIDAVLSMGDAIRYFPASIQWVGFNSCKIPVLHQARYEGKSSYSMKKLLSLAFDTIVSFSDKPLKICTSLGLAIVLLTVLVSGVYFLRFLTGQIKVSGYASIILSIWFLSGCIISMLGVVGLYLGRVFDQVKRRPLFIVSEKRNV